MKQRNFNLLAAVAVLLFGYQQLPARHAVRHAAPRRAFQVSHPCPANGAKRGACPGYVVDHIVPLCKGGADKVENMQWQTKENAKIKDRTECRS